MSVDTIIRKKHFKVLEKCTTPQLAMMVELANTKGAMQGIVENKEMLLSALQSI
jgi:hypothetical protein